MPQTHYDTLRVPPSASDSEIRDAYRRLAREHHPDRTASRGSAAGGSSELSMPAINEAYRVLGDPARRAVYDAGLRSAASGPRDGAERDDPHDGTHVRSGHPDRPPVHPSHVGPARIPWRSMLVVGLTAVIGVVVLAQFTEPGEPPGPDAIIGVGSCVAIEPDNSVREVACVGDPATDIVVEAFVPFDARCPGATLPYRDRQGMGVACIAVPD
jgi:molecular chaperone DnaJ